MDVEPELSTELPMGHRRLISFPEGTPRHETGGARPREANTRECRGPRAKPRYHFCSGRKMGTHRDRGGPLRPGMQARPANSRTRTWCERPLAILSASPGPSRDPLKTLANRTSPFPYAPSTPYPLIRVSVSRSLLEKWRRESCPIDCSESTLSAHVQRTCSRAPSNPDSLVSLPFSPSYSLARSRRSFTFSELITSATALNPKGCV